MVWNLEFANRIGACRLIKAASVPVLPGRRTNLQGQCVVESVILGAFCQRGPIVELREIDKAQYKRRLNRLQGGTVLALFVLGIGLAELYRALWADGESSTLLNAAGVLSAVAILGVVFSQIKDKPWMSDIRYTWRLKQELNRIYRSSRKLEEALANDHPTALCIQNFHLRGSRHLYLIEDNTLTVPELDEKIAELDARIAALGLQISTDDYYPELLKQLG